MMAQKRKPAHRRPQTPALSAYTAAVLHFMRKFVSTSGSCCCSYFSKLILTDEKYILVENVVFYRFVSHARVQLYQTDKLMDRPKFHGLLITHTFFPLLLSPPVCVCQCQNSASIKHKGLHFSCLKGNTRNSHKKM